MKVIRYSFMKLKLSNVNTIIFKAYKIVCGALLGSAVSPLITQQARYQASR